jgi:hypothetical protein
VPSGSSVTFRPVFLENAPRLLGAMVTHHLGTHHDHPIRPGQKIGTDHLEAIIPGIVGTRHQGRGFEDLFDLYLRCRSASLPESLLISHAPNSRLPSPQVISWIFIPSELQNCPAHASRRK